MFRSVGFLGHIICGKDVEVYPKKTDAVRNCPLNPIYIRSFFGLAGYYRRFVDGFAYIDSTLKTLTKNKVKFEWSEVCERSFQEFKDKLTFAPTLTLLEGTKVL